ncbi:hypothetical protein TRV_01393 [Trichophyton verrucosum HKI 0517]|uniref:Uncharacterized protein n=1 Tax=Trichophyton verrucosum (strain HKI 0517) TaxID=663202 RepID=D4D2T7_TRIVH|nr:uncharacterized protein TRV_01393 [Trichophyton verrucosum HKI 0517]EFE43819.1 hypothetical protein TRV_01393 [Trichophyton verrucosum HKI 0517]
MIAAAAHFISSSPFSRALLSPFDSPPPLQPLFFLCFCCCFVFCAGVLVVLLMRLLDELSFFHRVQQICQQVYHSVVSFVFLPSIPRIPTIPGRQSLSFSNSRLLAWRLPRGGIRIFQASSRSPPASISSIPPIPPSTSTSTPVSSSASGSPSGGRGDSCLHLSKHPNIFFPLFFFVLPTTTTSPRPLRSLQLQRLLTILAFITFKSALPSAPFVYLCSAKSIRSVLSTSPASKLKVLTSCLLSVYHLAKLSTPFFTLLSSSKTSVTVFFTLSTACTRSIRPSSLSRCPSITPRDSCLPLTKTLFYHAYQDYQVYSTSKSSLFYASHVRLLPKLPYNPLSNLYQIHHSHSTTITMASQSEQMEWEPTTPIRTLLPGQVLTLQRELLVARAGRRRTMGLEYPATSADHRPALTRRPLERSSPKRQWARILAGVDVRFGEAPPAAPENGPVTQPCLPLNKDSPPITPRKRVIEEVDEPEQYEDRFSDQTGQEAPSSVPNVIDSPQDVSMVDVFTPPHQSEETAPSQPRPNWFELQNRNRDGMAGSSLEASLQFGSSSHGAVDVNSLLSQIPGSWPVSPPRPLAAPVDLPVQPSPEVKDALPSPNSRAREFLMVGGIESAGPERSTVVPRPADVPMTFLQPESRLLKFAKMLNGLLWLDSTNQQEYYFVSEENSHRFMDIPDLSGYPLTLCY